MNTYKTSSGDKVKKSTIDLKIRNSKKLYLENFLDSNDYYFCQDCKTTSSHLGCSHIISVNECQKSGKTEIAWDIKNYELLCHKCHDQHERLSSEEKWDKYLSNGEN